jgi:hypothetical protein
MKRHYHLFLGISLFLFSGNIFGQDLDSLINTQIKPKIDYASATFKASRIINGHSVQQMKRKQLDFRISHRFGTLNSGGYGLFGLDQSTIHFSLEYGVTDWLMLGVGRGSYNKMYDSFAKFRILRQSKGARTMPVSVSYMTSVEMNTMKLQDPTRTNYFSSRMSFVHQLLIARKFSEGFSFQLSPTIIHRNLVASDLDMNDVYSMGFGARYKLNKRTSLNVEYYYTYNPNHKFSATRYYNSASVGVDIETGGHVFQIMLTNSLGMREGTFIPQTTDSWTNGGIHLGFNISRVFAL